MGGLWGWVRSEWRRSWRALTVLTLLVAFGGAITIAAVAGARRADSAFNRFLEQTSSTIDVSVAGQSEDLSMFDGSQSLAGEMAAVPGVEGVLPVSWMGVSAEANDVTLPAFAIATLEGAGARPPVGAAAVRGHLPDSSRPHELAVNEIAADQLGVDVGDEITLNSYAPDQMVAMVSGVPAEFRGPQVVARVAGVIRTAEDVSDNSEPIVYLSGAFHDTYGADIARCDCSFWIRTAPDQVAAVSTALPAVFGEYPLVVEPVDSVLRARVADAVGLEVGALRIAALIGAIASALVVMQALVRHVGAERSANTTLTALGARRRDVVGAWAVTLLPVAIAGSAGAALAAIAMSPLFPRGLARQAVLHPGISFDLLAVVGGAAAVLLATVALTVAAAHVTVGRALPRRRGSESRRARTLVLRTRPTLALGANLAVDPARDRARLPAVSAVLGLALAVGGALAVALIDVSADEVLRSPHAFAADWELEMAEQPDDREAVIAATAAEPVDAFALNVRVSGNVFVASGPRGTALVSPGSLQPIVGTMGPFLERGLPATSPGDVVLGPAIADELGVDVGDSVTVESGGRGQQAFVVSGIGLLADSDETDQSFFVTPDGLARLQSIDELSVENAYVRVGAVDDDVLARLAELGWTEALPPSRVANLSEVGSVPRLLAIALAVLGLGSVTHSLLVAGRRRRHDLAVVTSLGFTRRQVASTVRWQGLLTAGAAIVLGLPLGALFGRLIWKRVADGVGAVDLVTVPWAMVLLAPAAALLAVGFVSSVIGARTATLDPARTLRGE